MRACTLLLGVESGMGRRHCHDMASITMAVLEVTLIGSGVHPYNRKLSLRFLVAGCALEPSPKLS